MVLDNNFRVKTANPAFYKAFKLKEQETEGKLFYELHNHSWESAELLSLFKDIVFEKKNMEDFEINLTISNTPLNLLLNAQRIQNEKEDEQLILLAIEDITERHNNEEKLNKINEELKQSNQQLEQFAYVTSHDLQEPLRKILTFSNRLQKKGYEGVSEEVKNYLERIDDATLRMSKLIKDLLSYARITNTRKLFQAIDLNHTLKNIIIDFELLLEEKKAQVKSDYLPTIESIPLQINQLFYNLLSNSFKFAKIDEALQVRISSSVIPNTELSRYPDLQEKISLYKESEVPIYYEIIFKDNGIGFDQKYADQIFAMFQRLQQAGKYEGTGIGLALVKKIVDNHNGIIFAKAKENEGVEIHLILPNIQPN